MKTGILTAEPGFSPRPFPSPFFKFPVFRTRRTIKILVALSNFCDVLKGQGTQGSWLIDQSVFS